MSERLIPCPFCGGEAELDFSSVTEYGNMSHQSGHVTCKNRDCDAEIGLYDFDPDDKLVRPSEILTEKWNTRSPQNEWISVNHLADLELPFESEEDPDSEGYPQFHGMISQTVEITDGEGRSFGHYRDDGVWVVYIRNHNHDFLNIRPEDITHYKVLDKLP